MNPNATMISIGLITVILAIVLYFLLWKPGNDTTIVQWPVVNAYNQKHREGMAIDIADKDMSDASEFSLSFWMIIDDWNHNYGKYKHILHLGSNSNINEGSIMVRLHPTVNKAVINLQVFSDSLKSSGVYMGDWLSGNSEKNETVEVEVPMQKWTNLVVSVMDRSMDVYVNGELIVSKMLTGLVKNVPMKKLYLVKYSGFGGKIGRVKLSNRSVNGESIYSNYRQELSGLMLPFQMPTANSETVEDETTESVD